MNAPISRRAAFSVVAASAGALALPRSVRAEEPDTPKSPVPASFPRQDEEAVREIVGVAHVDLNKVEALVEKRPALANAAYDWGFGDWETPLGAASHVGRREIAEFLLSKGARLDLFAA